MSIDYGLSALRKPRPKALDASDKRRARETRDRRESDKVRDRAGGRCECCWKRVSYGHVHHVLSGIGVRGRGESALARWKLFLCPRDHDLVHKRLLVIEGRPGRWVFRRVNRRA